MIVLISSDDEDHKSLEEKNRKCMDDVISTQAIDIRTRDDELRVLSDLTGYENLAAMMEAEAAIKSKNREKKNRKIEFSHQNQPRSNGSCIELPGKFNLVPTTEANAVLGSSRKRKRKRKRNSRKMGFNLQTEVIVDAEEKGEQVCDLKAVEATQVVETETVLEPEPAMFPVVETETVLEPEPDMPQKVDATKEEEQLDAFNGAETPKAIEVGDSARSSDVISQVFFSTEDNEAVADPSRSRDVEEMLLTEPVIDVPKEGVQSDTVEVVEESISLKTEMVPITNEKQEGTCEGIERGISYDTESFQMKDNIILRNLIRGPRYFDPLERSWRMCLCCGEEGHTSTNCVLRNWKKPCYICAGFEHSGKQCKQGHVCFICNGMGHLASACPEKHQGNNNVNSIICLRCGDSGHDMWWCESDYSPDDLKEIRCYMCNRFGHLCCVDLPDIAESQVSCYNCGKSGHLGSGCTMSHGKNNSSRSPALCYSCGETGHIARKCKKNIKVENTKGSLSAPQKLPNGKRNLLGSKCTPHGLKVWKTESDNNRAEKTMDDFSTPPGLFKEASDVSESKFTPNDLHQAQRKVTQHEGRALSPEKLPNEKRELSGSKSTPRNLHKDEEKDDTHSAERPPTPAKRWRKDKRTTRVMYFNRTRSNVWRAPSSGIHEGRNMFNLHLAPSTSQPYHQPRFPVNQAYYPIYPVNHYPTSYPPPRY